MHIIQNNATSRGNFIALNSDGQLGLLNYSWNGNESISIDDTEVRKDFESQGIGRQLVTKVVEFARAKKARIITRCPFAKKILETNGNFADVLA